MDDTEARAALNWIEWLQSQGARMHPNMRGAAPDARMGTQPPAAARPTNPSRPAARSTGPLAPTTEALRAMFAELDPGASGGASRPPVSAGAGGGAAGWDGAANAPAGWLADDAVPDPTLMRRPARQETETQRLAQAHALSKAGPASPSPDAVTLESLERQFASSGFLQVEPQPGLLAAMTAGESAAANAPDDTAGLPPGIADDYPGRLRLAQAWRAEGRLDDALAQYRAILKQAPDLLPDVLRELDACLRAAPEHPGVHRLLGDARIQQGDYLGALEAYNRAVALTQPEDA